MIKKNNNKRNVFESIISMSFDSNVTSSSHKCGWKVKSSDEGTLDVFVIYQSSKNIKINLLFVLAFNALVVAVLLEP